MPVSKVFDPSTEKPGDHSSARSPTFTSAVPAMCRPRLSSGLRVTRFTVPEMPPSIMSAVVFLNTSTRPSSSGDTSLNDSVRPPLAEKMSRPFSSERTNGRPRIRTPDPSTEKRSGSSRWAKREMLTPGTRCSASATERSASAPISSAVMTSTTVSASCLKSCALCSEARKPLTMMTLVSVSPASFAVSSSSVSCAKATLLAAMHSARPETPASARVRLPKDVVRLSIRADTSCSPH